MNLKLLEQPEIVLSPENIQRAWQEAQGQPNLRRATKNMVFSKRLLDKLFEVQPAHTKSISKNRMALVLGTAHGEIGATTDYFRAYTLEQIAKPIHFQNSLHNSTLGFLSIHYQLTGPTFAVSTLNENYFGALSAAKDSLLLKECDLAIALCIDWVPPEVIPWMKSSPYLTIAKGKIISLEETQE